MSRAPFLALLPGGRLHTRAPRPVAAHCPHQDLLIDVEDGWVECRTCGTDLDPYEMLARYADEETRLDILRKEISMDLAQGVLACGRCGAVPEKGER